MTYDELVKKVARALDPGMWKEHDQRGNMPTSIIISKGHAKTAIDTIREVLLEPKTLSIMRRSALVAQGLDHNEGLDYRLLMEQAIKSAIAASPLGEKRE